MFNAMLEGIKEESVALLFHAEIQQPAAVEEEAVADVELEPATPAATTSDGRSQRTRGRHAASPNEGRHAAPMLPRDDRPRMDNLQYSAPTLDSPDGERTSTKATSRNEPGRNAPCPCGSGKKYKRCHGAPQGAY